MRELREVLHLRKTREGTTGGPNTVWHGRRTDNIVADDEAKKREAIETNSQWLSARKQTALITSEFGITETTLYSVRPVLVLLKQDAHDQENVASTMHDIIVLPLAILRNV